jgi:peroxin-3
VISLPPTSPPKQPELESQPQQPQPPTQTKAQLWNQLKLLTFSRTLTTLYALVLLTLQTRIQLNLLGRHSYIRSVRELEREFAGEDAWFAEKRKPGDIAGGIDIDSETEMAYLTFSWWVMNVGWKAVSERVKMAVENVFSP